MRGTHDSQIMDQFTRQAKTFAAVAAHSSESSLRLLAASAQLSSTDEVLDVACGPGIVACHLARTARHVTGIDVVPAMLEQARKRQTAAGLANLSWRLGAVESLPSSPDSFSLVVTRYSFHHLLQPKKAFAEMYRVCRPGGRILISDVTPEPGKAQAYDELEKLRDPSHVHAMTLDELKALADQSAADLETHNAFLLEIPLETQVAASFTPHADRIRELVRQDIGINKLSVNADVRDGQVWYKLPISVLVWRKR